MILVTPRQMLSTAIHHHQPATSHQLRTCRQCSLRTQEAPPIPLRSTEGLTMTTAEGHLTPTLPMAKTPISIEDLLVLLQTAIPDRILEHMVQSMLNLAMHRPKWHRPPPGSGLPLLAGTAENARFVLSSSSTLTKPKWNFYSSFQYPICRLIYPLADTKIDSMQRLSECPRWKVSKLC